MHIRKGDQVEVLSGKDKGKRGRVLVLFPSDQRAIVEGVNLVKKHQRQNQRRGQQAGVVEQEAPVHISNLLPVDPESGEPTRVGHKILEIEGGKTRKVRIARKSGVELDR